MSKNRFDAVATVNLTDYPLDQIAGPAYSRLVEEKRAELNRDQFCILPEFLREPVRRQLVANVDQLQDRANRADSRRNVYLQRTGSPELPDDHPRNIFSSASYRMIGAHLLPDNSPLKGLYFWQPMQQFIAEIVGVPRLYPSADPYQPVNVICYGDGDRSAWHFDSDNAFTITLMLQAPESGGDFEIVPNIRSDEDPNIEALSRVLLGDRSPVISLERSEGALVIFRGCHSAHRVTPVAGNKSRQMCVMVYELEPGVIGDPVVNETVYGVVRKSVDA
jgi:hypothetical protein